MVAIAPRNPRYLREVGYAEGDICSVDVQLPAQARDAIRSCTIALDYMEQVARRLPWSPTIAVDLANRHAWLADAYRVNGDYARALSERHKQERLLSEAMRRDPKNMDLKNFWIYLQRNLALMEYWNGNLQAGLERLARAVSISDQLVRFDRSNQSWAEQRAMLADDLARLHSFQTRERMQ
jgi:tetratricopeptide (TPR) repeat protein